MYYHVITITSEFSQVSCKSYNNNKFDIVFSFPTKCYKLTSYFSILLELWCKLWFSGKQYFSGPVCVIAKERINKENGYKNFVIESVSIDLDNNKWTYILKTLGGVNQLNYKVTAIWAVLFAYDLGLSSYILEGDFIISTVVINALKSEEESLASFRHLLAIVQPTIVAFNHISFFILVK